MGRIGVSLEEVENAALQLQGRGKNPSVDAIRELLGTGSKTTIANHLRDWKAQQSNAAGKLPQELIALVTGLWERLNTLADQHILEIQKTNEEQVQTLKKDLAQSLQNYTDLNKNFTQNQEILSTERSTKEKLIKELTIKSQEHSKLLERYEAINQRLEDQKEENKRLHQLASNLQTNLEHYQHSVQKLQMEQMLSLEKQQAQFQKERISLQAELVLKTKQIQECQRQLDHKSLESEQLQKQYGLLEKTNKLLTQEDQENKHKLSVIQERCEKALNTLVERDYTLINKAHQITELEKQIAVLNDKNVYLNQNLVETKDKNETLLSEKLFLSQEKHELQGYLRQLENKKNTIPIT